MAGQDSEQDRARLEAALTQASDEAQLQPWYRDCVRPLLRLEESGWPRCCGGGCEPCAETLKTVAKRVRELLAVDDDAAAAR